MRSRHSKVLIGLWERVCEWTSSAFVPSWRILCELRDFRCYRGGAMVASGGKVELGPSCLSPGTPSGVICAPTSPHRPLQHGTARASSRPRHRACSLAQWTAPGIASRSEKPRQAWGRAGLIGVQRETLCRRDWWWATETNAERLFQELRAFAHQCPCSADMESNRDRTRRASDWVARHTCPCAPT